MYPARPDNRKQKIAATLVVIVAVALLGSTVKAYNDRQKSPVVSVSSPPPAAQAQASAGSDGSQNPSSSSAFKDGSYTASANYLVPTGQENIQVTLTVKGGAVTSSQIQNSETNPESAQFQEYFASQYKSQVIGKSLSGLQIAYIAGASDTCQAFNSAVKNIQNQAQA